MGNGMNIVFNEAFHSSTYASDGAASPGRMACIMSLLEKEPGFEVLQALPASREDLLLAHDVERVSAAEADKPLYDMALLAAGGAVLAAQSAMAEEPAFACVRPPGHHASRASAWGYCVFCNIGIALLKIRKERNLGSAFVLDFDAHTGDGTMDVLKGWKEAIVFNPYADTNLEYVALVESRIRQIEHVDIIAVSAGFDSGIHDLGHKLETGDFYEIGRLLRDMSRRMGHNRRFAVLEGGYYLPALGENVLAFCRGFA